MALKHLLLGFGKTDCVNALRNVGFPGDYGELGEVVETGEVRGIDAIFASQAVC